jgi:hypothetical protein
LRTPIPCKVASPEPAWRGKRSSSDRSHNPVTDGNHAPTDFPHEEPPIADYERLRQLPMVHSSGTDCAVLRARSQWPAGSHRGMSGYPLGGEHGHLRPARQLGPKTQRLLTIFTRLLKFTLVTKRFASVALDNTMGFTFRLAANRLFHAIGSSRK